MMFFKKRKDGGAELNVTGYWLIECKSLFSIALLHFSEGSREAYHSHAFNAFSVILKGMLLEKFLDGRERILLPFWKFNESHSGEKVYLPFVTRRNDFHKVYGCETDTWALTFRGPWAKDWQEYLPAQEKFVTLTNGRKIVIETDDNVYKIKR